ncbi:MAG: twitching motility protein PilT, partial [Syntrophaceae bacterium]|nr:twitching motility protein PilT [Syntrophaceae bacterium]
ASHTEFHMCPHCKGVYWPGTHIEKVQSFLRTHIQNHHP